MPIICKRTRHVAAWQSADPNKACQLSSTSYPARPYALIHSCERASDTVLSTPCNGQTCSPLTPFNHLSWRPSIASPSLRCGDVHAATIAYIDAAAFPKNRYNADESFQGACVRPGVRKAPETGYRTNKLCDFPCMQSQQHTACYLKSQKHLIGPCWSLKERRLSRPNR